ncbi:MAG: SUMF1/EgtB/PvdO family nonheme iron enzyme, partial [Treponema sp.]|nr:SUMF1/EgtB/PvdO family nonheme iron enzyme [Treponema sp.]
GLYDMSGNVWEWCDNLYSSSSSNRVYRGGSYYGYDFNCTVSYRSDLYPYSRSSDLGFRVVRSAQ